MRTSLLEHNKTAYRKVTEALQSANRTCVVHPTGTGKSYLIAAVSEDYKRVLVLGPNTFVLDQVADVLKWRKRGIEYMTYALLMHTENPRTDYNLICLDEFHRAGAPEWGAAIDRLLALNPQAKVLGTTATPVRWLDDNRDMADELFGGNVASQMSIAEAWNRNILPIPRYVSGLFRWDKAIAEATDRINRNRTLTDDDKRDRIFRLSNARLHWEMSYGMPAILKKHLDRDARRVIVFCGGIESIDQMQHDVVGWFNKAGFKVQGICLMHSNLTDREQREQMERFEQNDGDGLRLMFSVNMLNEGIHVPNVNAVLMLRTTASRIIYMQQMGRCLTAANTQKPLVLDMVDNITTTNAIKCLQDEFNAIEVPQAEIEGRQPRKFEVHDYTLSISRLMKEFAPALHTYVSFEECLAQVTAYCEKHGHFPGKKADREIRLNYIKLRNYADRPEVQALVERYGRKVLSQEVKIQMMQEFTAKHHRKPLWSEKEMYAIWGTMIGEDKGDPRVKAMREKYMPTKMTQEDRVETMLQFTARYGRKPMPGEKEMYRMWHDMLEPGKDDTRVIAMRQKYGPKTLTTDEKIEAMQEFTAKHGRRPNMSEKKEYAIWRYMVWHHKADARVIALRQQYDDKTISLDDKIKMMEVFTAQHHRRPLPSETDMHSIWSRMVQHVKKNSRIRALCDKYGASAMPRVKDNT